MVGPGLQIVRPSTLTHDREPLTQLVQLNRQPFLERHEERNHLDFENSKFRKNLYNLEIV